LRESESEREGAPEGRRPCCSVEREEMRASERQREREREREREKDSERERQHT